MAKCPRCGKTLKTKRGVADHIRTVHGNGNNSNGKRNGNGGKRGKGKGITHPMQKMCGRKGIQSMGALHRPMVNTVSTLQGTDYLGKISTVVDTSVAADSILFTKYISPSEYAGTRLKSLADLWERYRFRQFRLRFVSAVPDTLGCQIITYQDTDPQDSPLGIKDPEALIRQATAQTGAQQWNFNEDMVIDLAQRADDQWYYTGILRTGTGEGTVANARFSRQGAFYLIQVTNVLNHLGEEVTAPIQVGSVYVDWIVDFQTPQIEPEISEGLAVSEFDFNTLKGSTTSGGVYQLGRFFKIKTGSVAAYLSLAQMSGNALMTKSRWRGMIVNDDTTTSQFDGVLGSRNVSYSDLNVDDTDATNISFNRLVGLKANRTYRVAVQVLDETESELEEEVDLIKIHCYHPFESEPHVSGPYFWSGSGGRSVVDGAGVDEVDGINTLFSKVNVYNIQPTLIGQAPTSIRL